LLHKNPERHHISELPFGTAHVLYPEATEDRCAMSFLVDIDPVGLVRNHRGPRGNDFSLSQYVNDRPFATSSFMSVALAKVFSTAMGGRSKERPELADQAIPLEVILPVVPCRGGEGILRRLFEPLGYDVQASAIPLDNSFPSWGESRYLSVQLRGDKKVKDLLEHLYVLLPVLDDDKHYWVGNDEVEKLLRRGGEWLSTHPEKELIANRYLRHDAGLTREAVTRLQEEDADDPEQLAQTQDAEEELVERPLSLNELRISAVTEAIAASGARRVLDLGCGEGKLTGALLKLSSIDHVVGLDVSHRSLEIAARRLHLDTMTPRQRERVELQQGSLTYRDRRLEGLDLAAIVEVIEHLDRTRLDSFERVVFAHAHPAHVIITTPNLEYNVRFEALPAGTLRHRDHRFEWTRPEFASWANGVAGRHGYEVRLTPIGPIDDEVGSPTQMAVFSR
jgi:3' terminal RNA ribose 2'-O-methyltransferase Hen1